MEGFFCARPNLLFYEILPESVGFFKADLSEIPILVLVGVLNSMYENYSGMDVVAFEKSCCLCFFLSSLSNSSF